MNRWLRGGCCAERSSLALEGLTPRTAGQVFFFLAGYKEGEVFLGQSGCFQGWAGRAPERTLDPVPQRLLQVPTRWRRRCVPQRSGAQSRLMFTEENCRPVFH